MSCILPRESPSRGAPARIKSASTALIKAPIKATKFALAHPKLMKKIVFPLFLTTCSTPLVTSLPLGPLGPVLAMVAVACGRFQLRREMVGGGYALMQAFGMAGIKGQALGLLGLVGLEASGTNLVRSSLLTTMFVPNIRPLAQIIGLAISVLSTTTGTFSTLGALLGARSMTLLFNELRSFITFQGLRWAAENLQDLWEIFKCSSVAVKAAFLQYVLRNLCNVPFGKGLEMSKIEERVAWAKDYMNKVAQKLPLFPVEAVSPELAVMLKVWDQDTEAPQVDTEPMNEWVKVECGDGKMWSSIVYEMEDSKEYQTEAGISGETSVVDRSHHRSPAENARNLEQVARETLAKSGTGEEEISATVASMGLDWHPDEDEEFGIEELEDEDDEDENWLGLSDLDDPMEPSALR